MSSIQVKIAGKWEKFTDPQFLTEFAANNMWDLATPYVAQAQKK